MSSNDFFMVAYKILSYLRHCYETDDTPSPDVLNGAMVNISQLQFVRTLKKLNAAGYIEGLHIVHTKDGDLIGGINQLSITIEGLQYLSENSMMRKAYNTAKEFRDWLPFIK
jgi:hypothetical protein